MESGSRICATGRPLSGWAMQEAECGRRPVDGSVRFETFGGTVCATTSTCTPRPFPELPDPLGHSSLREVESPGTGLAQVRRHD